MKFVFYAYIVYWTVANTTNSYMVIVIMQNIKEQALATYTWTNNIVQKTDTYMYQKITMDQLSYNLSWHKAN